MPPTPPASGTVRPATTVNEEIRAIVVGAKGRQWTVAERTLYGLLLMEWEAAVRAEIVAAA
ncbi:MAG: hypothetical protein HOY79_24295 [Streptomyces sp.]|nr:hypothetical protein [Streptomyces sp.]NUR26156.1 hypothetical protein [Catenulispora sp.]